MTGFATGSNEKLFEFIYESVLGEGGDGDMAVVLTERSHRDVANEFEEFLKNKSSHHVWSRRDIPLVAGPEGGDIVFWSDQESYTFAGDDHFCSYLDGRLGLGYPEGKIPCTFKVVIS